MCIVNRPIAATVGLALLLGSTFALAFTPSLYPAYDEGRTYVAMANGDYSNVYSYYGGRLLHPLVARVVARVAHMPIDARVFLWISIAALVGFFAILGVYYGLDYSSAGRLWLLLLVTATVVDAYRNYYWQDLFYAALCAFFFLMLRANPWISLPLVFLLYLTRESTIVLVASLVAVSLLRRRWTFGFAILVVGLAAMKIDSALVARGLPNNQGIPIVLLDVLKVPYNFAFNVCGLEFWIDTNAATLGPPIWTTHVPTWLHLGNIREVGYCGFFWERPARALLTMSTAFGILPLAVIRTAARDWERLLQERFDILTALLYGALMFLLTPLVGTSPARYVLYGWPVFWLFGVSALHMSIPDSRKRVGIVLLSLCSSWTPAVVRLVTGPPIDGPQSVSSVTRTGLALSLAITTAAYLCAWHLLRPARSAAR